MDFNELIKIALDAKKNAYTPYSNFQVGAAVLTSTGKVFTGVNIENVALGSSICAERVAISKAISEGEKSFKVIAIISDSPEIVYPCGECRQYISEFAKQGFVFLCCNNKGEFKEIKVEQMIPLPFTM